MPIFRKGTTLDPTQVEDRRGRGGMVGARRRWRRHHRRRRRRPLSPARGQQRWPRRPDEPRGAGARGQRWRQLDARAGLPHGRGRQHARRLPHPRLRQQHPALLGRRVRGGRALVHAVDHRFLRRIDEHRLRFREHGRRSVLLPGGQEGVHRPRLLRCPPRSARRAGRPDRAGLRPRARVRPSRPGPARDPRSDRRRPAGRAEQVRAERAPGRLLRRHLGEPRCADHARAPHAGRHRGRARRRGLRRRRSHPGEDSGPGQPRDLDARLLRPAAEVVQRRLPRRAA